MSFFHPILYVHSFEALNNLNLFAFPLMLNYFFFITLKEFYFLYENFSLSEKKNILMC